MSKIFVFLFFLLFSFLFTPWFARESFYFFSNHANLYTPFFFLFWFTVATFFTGFYYVILKNIPFKWVRVLLRVVVFSLGLYYIFFSIFMVLLITPWKFDGCGEEFNKAFYNALKNKNDSFCYDLKNIKMNLTYVKESATCLAPNKQSINLKDGNGIADCISALKK